MPALRKYPDELRVDDLALGTLNWVRWFNNHKLHSSIGYVPPAELEKHH